MRFAVNTRVPLRAVFELFCGGGIVAGAFVREATKELVVTVGVKSRGNLGVLWWIEWVGPAGEPLFDSGGDPRVHRTEESRR